MVDRILQDLLSKYQTCSTYTDVGTLYAGDDGAFVPCVRFATHFERPADFRFE